VTAIVGRQLPSATAGNQALFCLSLPKCRIFATPNVGGFTLHSAPSNACTIHAYDCPQANVPAGTCHTPVDSTFDNAIRVLDELYTANWNCNDGFGCPSSGALFRAP
jgi:hypothetical protein